jgi:hypothetical protein
MPGAQPTREFPQNKSKKNQANPSKIAWISLDSFGRIGTFQLLTANPNKKFPPAELASLGCAQRRLEGMPLRSPSRIFTDR